MQRIARPVEDREVSGPQATASPSQEREPSESQTWVLFSAATDATSASYLSETEGSLQTPGRSRLSDLGSLNTVAGTGRHEARPSVGASALEEESIEEDAELDSLDSHLPEFRSLPGVFSHSQQDSHHAVPVLPGHDGLGSFRLDQPTLGTDAQDQIYQFERFNPRRIRRRRDSGGPIQPELELEQTEEADKRRWIEAWRLEQSRLLLDEVQRETRRRRRSQASSHRVEVPGSSSLQAPGVADAASDNETWHDEEGVETGGQSEGFLARIARTVIKDILGIDDQLLSVLMGETLPDEDDLSSTPRASHLVGQGSSPTEPDSSWHVDLLERVSRELGLLVNHLSQHPGAFSTFSRVQQAPLPYAGLPAIPESNTTHADAESAVTPPLPASMPDFQPTVIQTTRPMDIPGRPSEGSRQEDVSMGNTFTKEEWEQDLDIKLVFRYLRSRFTSRGNSSPQAGSSSYLASSSTHDMAAKAARVRQHHPLVSRSRPAFKATTPGSPVLLRHHSSCASQSTRRSTRRSSCSSRHYWDIGGSLGTGSMIAPNGPMGSWGEV